MLPVEFAHIRPEKILENAMIPAALAAGRVVASEFYKKGYSYSQKSNSGDLVTEIDIKASELIQSILKRMCSDIIVLDEEIKNDYELNRTETMFVVDPIDGTLNFVHGYSEVAVSIGLMHEGKPIAGVVYQPILSNLYYGIDGKGAWKNGVAIRIGGEEYLGETLIATGIPYEQHLKTERFIKPVGHLINLVREVRVLGSAASALCYVASGQLSGFFEYGLSPWDVAGGAAIILGAGGVVLPINRDSDPVFDGSIVTANARISNILRNELLSQNKE